MQLRVISCNEDGNEFRIASCPISMPFQMVDVTVLVRYTAEKTETKLSHGTHLNFSLIKHWAELLRCDINLPVCVKSRLDMIIFGIHKHIVHLILTFDTFFILSLNCQ